MLNYSIATRSNKIVSHKRKFRELYYWGTRNPNAILFTSQ